MDCRSVLMRAEAVRTPQLHYQLSHSYQNIFLFRTISCLQCSKLRHHTEYKLVTWSLSVESLEFCFSFPFPYQLLQAWVSWEVSAQWFQNQPGFLLIAFLTDLIFLHAFSSCLLCTFLVLPHSQLPVPWLIFFWMKRSRQMSHQYNHYDFLWCS